MSPDSPLDGFTSYHSNTDGDHWIRTTVASQNTYGKENYADDRPGVVLVHVVL